MVVEKTDYLTGRNVRYLRVDTPDLPSSQVGGEDGGAGGGAGTGGGASTPPPRENGEGPFGNGSGNVNSGASGSGNGSGSGGSSGGGGGGSVSRSQPQNGLGGWAPPSNTMISPERLFGDVTASSSTPVGAAGSNGS